MASLYRAVAVLQVSSRASLNKHFRLNDTGVSIYKSLCKMQLEGIVLPPACTGAYRFESPVAVMSVALALESCVALLLLFRRLESCVASNKWAGLAGRVALTGAVVLFPTVIRDSSRLLRCETVSVNAESLAALDGGAVMNHASGAVKVALLADDPYIVCWSGR